MPFAPPSRRHPRRHHVVGVLLIAAIALAACAGIFSVEKPILVTDTEAGTGVGIGVEAGGLSNPDGGGCMGEGCTCVGDTDCHDPAFKSCVQGKCVECTTTPDNCPDARYCLASATAPNACAPGCKTSSECTAISAIAKFCNTTRHQCVGCLNDGDCTGGTKCSPSGTCAEPCVGDGGGGGGCPANKQCCGSFCIDPQTDLLNCNGCGLACNGDGAFCCAGQCKASLTDVANCGACGALCSTTNGTPSCSAGSCKWACNQGFSHCGGTANTGCETATDSDINRCGGCNINCTANVKNANGIGCSASLCTYTGGCKAGYADCDTNTANGCECAAVTCPPGCTSCLNNVCQIDCTPGNCDGVTCPPGLPCRVRCIGEHACQGALVCPSGFACNVECRNSQQACNGLNINADNSTLCVDCDGASQACNQVSCTEPAGIDCKKHCGTSACVSTCGNCGNVGACP